MIEGSLYTKRDLQLFQQLEVLRRYKAWWILVCSLLVGCATLQEQPVELTTKQGLIALASTINLVQDETLILVEQRHITKKQACKVQQYALLAKSIMEEAWEALEQEDEATAVEYLAAARNAFAGISVAAVELVADHCGGNP